MGAGRAKKGNSIDQGIGIFDHVKVGNHLEKGNPLFTIFSKNTNDAEKARVRLISALKWSETKIEPLPLYYGVIGEV